MAKSLGVHHSAKMLKPSAHPILHIPLNSLITSSATASALMLPVSRQGQVSTHAAHKRTGTGQQTLA